MLRKTVIILAFIMLTPFMLLLGAALFAFAMFVMMLDALEDQSWNNQVAGDSTGAEEEI